MFMRLSTTPSLVGWRDTAARTAQNDHGWDAFLLPGISGSVDWMTRRGGVQRRHPTISTYRAAFKTAVC